MNGALASLGLQAPHLMQLVGPRGRIFEAITSVEAPSMFPAPGANQGQLSRDIPAEKSAARPSLGGAQLRSAHTGPVRSVGGGRRRSRPSGLGTHRLGQNGCVWVGDCNKS